MSSDSIYLDYNASVPVRPEASDAMHHALGVNGNASSVHAAGRAVRDLVEGARWQIADLINASPENVVFTSGATEANVTALTCAHADRLIVSAVEHDSVLVPAQRSGLPVDVIPVDAEGVVDLDTLKRQLNEGRGRALVSLMLANNETGVIQPVAEAAQIAREAGALIHSDAVQGLGKIPLDMVALGVDMVSLSAHKMGGPQGVGALVVRDGLTVEPLVTGGGQEQNRRAGTENAPGIAGFGAAVQAVHQRPVDWERIAAWRNLWEVRVLEAVPEAMVFSAGAERLANTSSVFMPGVTSETQVMALDLEGVCVSAGAACSSGKVKPSHVLEAMGFAKQSGSAIRVSLGWATRETDLDRLFEVWMELFDRTHRRKAS